MRQRLEPAPRASRTVLIRRTLSILFPPRDFAGLQHPLSCVCDRVTTASSTVDCWAHLAGLVESLLSILLFWCTLCSCATWTTWHCLPKGHFQGGARPLHRGKRLQVDCISSRRYNTYRWKSTSTRESRWLEFVHQFKASITMSSLNVVSATAQSKSSRDSPRSTRR